MKHIIYLLCLLAVSYSYAANNCIEFKKNSSDYESEMTYDLEASITDCKKEKRKIDIFGYFGDSPKVNFYFFKNINSVNRLFISTYVYTDIKEEKPKYVYNEGKYNFIYVYDCNKLSCKKNEKMSNFFGNGADLVEVRYYKTVSKFPYESIEKLKQELNSNFFKNWISGQLKIGYVTKKTYIYEDKGIDSKKTGYLIFDDKFTIKDISSRWLYIKYKNKNGRIITGWVACNDTDVCD